MEVSLFLYASGGDSLLPCSKEASGKARRSLGEGGGWFPRVGVAYVPKRSNGTLNYERNERPRKQKWNNSLFIIHHSSFNPCIPFNLGE